MTFEETLKLWLENRAMTDAEFKKDFDKKNKSVKDCVKYIEARLLQKVMKERSKAKDKTRCSVAAPSDDECFAMALEYYSNGDIKLEPQMGDMVKILSLSATTFTDEEKDKMRKEAEEWYKSSVRANLTKDNNKPDVKEEKPEAKEEPKQVTMKPKYEKKENKNKSKNGTATQLSLF